MEEDPNNYKFITALIKDKRTFKEYFVELLKEKQYIYYTFVNKNDIETKEIKIIMFIFSL